MGYADVNGLSLYFEESGDGEIPLVLLHGGLGSGEMFAPILPALAEKRRVVTVDLQGHGRTADADRPFRPETMAEDVAALAGRLGAERIDLLGYSLGGEVALRTAIQHPDVVRRLVLVSVTFRRDGNFPEVLAAMDGFGPHLAEPFKQSPVYESYARLAPRPDDWPALIAKTAELLGKDYDWTAEVAELRPPTLLVFADADSIRPEHVLEFHRLLGGGLRDPGVDGADRPASRLAIIPGATHYDVAASPLLPAVVTPFLDAPALP
ncbi:alpha/beta fold hydrolase [Bailinhaonella thermotolerans]|uniref:Alpha/beta fold hydrolase n=1 Tax=Bailinhaonella thermotolerans TaxID=1070861 RepID=A0A3A4AFG0_9ACTN|nr:alpha/beta hydrolase [Bailinhaonella thermotolerans]RJL27089.1 alpha/beta fold hydrolase [Bailinhaonella thermotolerans]